jgi:DNA modification methylase
MIRMPTEDEPVVLLQGDCLELLPQIEAGAVDAVVTDPPYGIGFNYHGYDDTRDNLRRLIEGMMPELRRVARRVYILPGVTQVALYPEPDWIMCVTWDTTGSHGKYGFTQWMPVLCYGSDVAGFARLSNGVLKTDTLAIRGGGGVGFQRSESERDHTCPKPLNLMRMLARRLTNPDETILDPFAGSGTTAIASIQTGRRCLAIELDPRYYAVARKRIDDYLAAGPLFDSTPKQSDLFMEVEE